MASLRVLWCLTLALIGWSEAQENGRYSLPSLSSLREVQKPQIPAGLESYFDLSGPARQVVDLFGIRPGIIPERNFDVSNNFARANSIAVGPTSSNVLASGLEQTVSNLLGSSRITPENLGGALPPGFFSGLQVSGTPKTSQERNSTGTNGTANKSSIAGIPNVFPTLPRAPIPQPQVAPALPTLPKIPTRPEVPEGGLGPLAAAGSDIVPPPPPPPPPAPGAFSLPASFLAGSGLLGGALPAGANGLPPPPIPPNFLPPGQAPAPGGNNLIGQLMHLVGLNNVSPNVDVGSLNRLFGITPQNQGVVSSVLYNALTDGTIQHRPNDTNATAAQAAQSLRANVGLIQQLITQPDSPLCNPKPTPVQTFDPDAFMGTWYQVLYSPPLSAGPCSMVSYKKLYGGARGGVGTLFETFEYTTEETPYGRPKISSGYAQVRGPGQLTYRTTSSPNDVNVMILATSKEVSDKGQYEYVVLAVNCNYPLHVYARDPVKYKQKYEGEVSAFLEQRGLTNGFSRLLNVVAPVDSTLCNFPPTLFNIQG